MGAVVSTNEKRSSSSCRLIDVVKTRWLDASTSSADDSVNRAPA